LKTHNSRPARMPWQWLGIMERKVGTPAKIKAIPTNLTILRPSAGIAARKGISEGTAILREEK